jgi:hypothetical protein
VTTLGTTLIYLSKSVQEKKNENKIKQNKNKNKPPPPPPTPPKKTTTRTKQSEANISNILRTKGLFIFISNLSA